MSFAEKGAAVSREQLLHALAMVFTIVQKRAVKVGRLRRLPRLELESDSHDHDTQLAVAKSAQWIESA